MINFLIVIVAIVSKPQNSAALLSVLHSCVDHIEKIIEYHSPSAAIIKPPPPLPPKPSHVSKPVLPPKPTTSVTPIPSTIATSDVKSSVSNKGWKIILIIISLLTNYSR